MIFGIVLVLNKILKGKAKRQIAQIFSAHEQDINIFVFNIHQGEVL
jgi:hypothetical protein